jgi:hypothetical protein
MTPEQLVLILLVVLGAVLTIALLGCLRTLAGLRLELASAGRQRLPGETLAAGRPVPDFLRDVLPWREEDGLVVFVSSDCPLCAEAITILPKVRIANVAIAPVGERDEVLRELGDEDLVLPEGVAKSAAEHFGLEYVPLGIHVRDGVVIGSIHTEALASSDEIERFWQFGGARLMEVAA